jgi:hypothetical protein
MATPIYSSNWIAIPADDTPVAVVHNLNRMPVTVSIEVRRPDGQGGYDTGMPAPSEGELPRMLSVDTRSSVTEISVVKPNDLSVSGDFRIQIFQ